MTTFFFSILVGVCSAQLTSYISPAALSYLQTKSLDLIGLPISLRETYYAIKLLKVLKVSALKCNCNAIASLLSTSTDGYSLHYGLQSLSECGCPKKVVPTDVKQALLFGVEVNIFINLASVYTNVLSFCSLLICKLLLRHLLP